MYVVYDLIKKNLKIDQTMFKALELTITLIFLYFDKTRSI